MEQGKKNKRKDTRKPYQKPAILYREALEAIAVDCISSGGKADLGTCPSGPINS